VNQRKQVIFKLAFKNSSPMQARVGDLQVESSTEKARSAN